MYKATYSSIYDRYGFSAGTADFGFRPWQWDVATAKKAIQECKATMGKIIRIDMGAEYNIDGVMVGEYDPMQKEYHRQIFELCAQNDLHPEIAMQSGVPNRQAYRTLLANATGDPSYITDRDKFAAATNRRKVKLPRVFWPIMNKHMSDVMQLGAEVYAANGKQWVGYSICDLDNEMAYVIDAEVIADPSIPYGTFPPGYNEMMMHRLNSEEGINFHGAIYIPGGYENAQGIDKELATGGGQFRQSATWENVHIYIPWVSGDTNATFAARMVAAANAFIAKLDALNDPLRSGKPIFISEFNGIDIPVNLRKSVMIYTAKQLIKNSRIIAAIGYAMVDVSWNGSNFTPSRWSIMDFPTLKWGSGGYVPYDYSVYPQTWTWASKQWVARDTWGTGDRNKECVAVVGDKMLLQFKKMFLGVNGPYWACGEIEAPALGFGTYTFDLDKSVSSVGNGAVFGIQFSQQTTTGASTLAVTSPEAIQVIQIGTSGVGQGGWSVIDSTGAVVTNPSPVVLKNENLILSIEYRPKFIKWTLKNSSGVILSEYEYTGFIPTTTTMKIGFTQGQQVTTKHIGLILHNFTFVP